MITEANIPNLMRCVRNNEGSGFFALDCFAAQGKCGTYACLVGHDRLSLGHAIRETEDGMFGADFETDSWPWARQEYGLSEEMAYFLFHFIDVRRIWNPEFGRNVAGSEWRSCDDQKAAVHRLRKFIYYILHKRELLYDDSGRVRETARRAEGDHHVLRQVKRKVEAECAGV